MPYQYAIDLLAEDGRVLQHAGVEPDWGAALDWTHFEGLRAGALPAVTRTGPGSVEPLWDARLGAPYVSGFRVTVQAGAHRVVREIPKAYLERTAQEIAGELVQRLQLEPGAVLRWIPSAVPVADAAPGTASDAVDVEEVAQPVPISPSSLADFLVGSVLQQRIAEGPRPMPVFVPEPVLAQVTALTRQAGEVETGGVLVGKLHRDVVCGHGGGGDLFLEITAHVPATHTVASATALTFTPATWAAARQAVARRGHPDELLAGWWHSHQDFCRLRGCPPERRGACTGSRPFFSAEDVHLHSACFPAGYQVGLLISASAVTGGLTSSLFGWSEGVVTAREFYVHTKGAHHAESVTT